MAALDTDIVELFGFVARCTLNCMRLKLVKLGLPESQDSGSVEGQLEWVRNG